MKLFSSLLVLAPVVTGMAGEIDYNRDVRPILAGKCYACHGPDEEARKAKLRLDDRATALKKEAFVPGKPDESELVYRIFSDDPDEVMPPPESKVTLTEKQKKILRQWIAEGAEYSLHWAFVPPVRPSPPKIKNEDWPRNELDRFILANLE
ncbi:MAG: c-type cytochrome domain-containing protein, partial [Opitutales bacterium]